jgi:8-oxo-dGTP diphosphatase
MLTVVAALIEFDGKLLACQRRRGRAFALQWEFPGGKVEQGESPAQALQRELLEELGTPARIGPEVYRTRHRYKELPGSIELVFHAAELDPRAIQNLDFEKILWCDRSSLPELNFLPADRELVSKLADGSLKIPPTE